MFDSRSKRRGWIVSVGVLTALLAMTTSASAQRSLFFEETAAAFWAVPHECADGSIVEGTLLVRARATSNRPIPRTRTPRPGCSFWPSVLTASHSAGGPDRSPRPSPARQPQARHRIGNRYRQGHPRWGPRGFLRRYVEGEGPLVTTVNGPGSKRVQREATATGQVTFDGELIVNGPANHPTRPAPFIRVDTEK